MQLHKRTFIVQEAAGKLERLMIDLMKEHELTFVEVFAMLAEQVSRTAKYALRAERHPNSDKRGDEA